MVGKFLQNWIPFNFFGKQVQLEDLIKNPLQPNETLRQCSLLGYCRRIQVPSQESNLWDKIVFWIQIHFNEKGHLEAIDKLISFFQESLFQNPPQATETLEAFNSQAEKLLALKNDYGFISLKLGDPQDVELRLQEIQKQAYCIFEAYLQKEALEKEEKRKQAFIAFRNHVDLQLFNLSQEYLRSLKKIRLFIMVPSENIQSLFEERVQSICYRLDLIKSLNQQIDEIEQEHQGKFTIPFINEYLNSLRINLCCEVHKISIEVEILIENLIINYQITHTHQQVDLILKFIQVNPDDVHPTQDALDYLSCSKNLNEEIARIQSFFRGKDLPPSFL